MECRCGHKIALAALEKPRNVDGVEHCHTNHECVIADAVPSLAALEMIERFIAFPTVARDCNLSLIAWTRDHLTRHIPVPATHAVTA